MQLKGLAWIASDNLATKKLLKIVTSESLLKVDKVHSRKSINSNNELNDGVRNILCKMESAQSCPCSYGKLCGEQLHWNAELNFTSTTIFANNNWSDEKKNHLTWTWLGLKLDSCKLDLCSKYSTHLPYLEESGISSPCNTTLFQIWQVELLKYRSSK